MAVVDYLLERYKPIIYIPKEKQSRALIDVIYEKFDRCYILWYHWPHDGYFTGHEDYEPIILFFTDQKLELIAIRPHNKYRNSKTWLTEQGKPIIIFTDPWHGSSIDMGQPIFSLIKKSPTMKKLSDYPLDKGKPPEWFWAADSGESIYDHIQSIIKLL